MTVGQIVLVVLAVLVLLACIFGVIIPNWPGRQAAAVLPPVGSESAAAPPPPQPTSKHVGAGKNLVVTLTRGFFHFNVACPGCAQGIEDNYVVRYDLDVSTAVILPEGSVWWYSPDFNPSELRRLTHNDPRDRWPNALPAWLNVNGVTLVTP